MTFWNRPNGKLKCFMNTGPGASSRLCGSSSYHIVVRHSEKKVIVTIG